MFSSTATLFPTPALPTSTTPQHPQGGCLDLSGVFHPVGSTYTNGCQSCRCVGHNLGACTAMTACQIG
jgi:hypothetical protein